MEQDVHDDYVRTDDTDGTFPNLDINKQLGWACRKRTVVTRRHCPRSAKRRKMFIQTKKNSPSAQEKPKYLLHSNSIKPIHQLRWSHKLQKMKK